MHLREYIIMSFTFTSEQREKIEEGKNWYRNSSEQVYQLDGRAGTGKSVVINQIVKELGIPPNRVAPMAYIGQAAIVMRMKGFYNAKTIHSWLYSPELIPVLDTKGNMIMDGYYNTPLMELAFIPKDLSDIDLIVIDEGGSVPYRHKSNIERHGIKILVSGDLGQLPPVEDRPAYLYEGKIHHLTQIMRQSEGSGIIYLADRARQGLPIHKGFYGDCYVIEESELTNQIISGADIMICGKNITRDIINKRVRYEMLGLNQDIPVYGEKLICRKNNWTIDLDGINLANGLIGTVVNVPGVHAFNGKSFKIDFRPDMLMNHFEGLNCDYDYFIAPYEQKKFMKNRKYAEGEKFEFAYCITTHLSQGAQYPNCIYLEEYLSKEIQNNLNYTGITRAVSSLIYVKKNRKIF
jgi:exodeoxyribonuclease-5